MKIKRTVLTTGRRKFDETFVLRVNAAKSKNYACQNIIKMHKLNIVG